MAPTDLNDFFLATAGAAASFIGLLFVAISFMLDDRKESEQERMSKRILAESSYAALLNVFFVSLVALIPHARLSYIIFAMAWAGLGGTVHFSRNRSVTRHNLAVLGFMTWIYASEAVFAIALFVRGKDYIVPSWQIAVLLLVLFSLGLVRAWELTGIRREEFERIERLKQGRRD